MAPQPFIALKCVVMIQPLQSVDFAQVFQSVIIFWFPSVSAALVLYLKTAALSCVTNNVIVDVFCIFSKILLLEVSFTVTLCSNLNLVIFKVFSNYLALAILQILCKCFSRSCHESMFVLKCFLPFCSYVYVK